MATLYLLGGGPRACARDSSWGLRRAALKLQRSNSGGNCFAVHPPDLARPRPAVRGQRAAFRPRPEETSEPSNHHFPAHEMCLVSLKPKVSAKGIGSRTRVDRPVRVAAERRKVRPDGLNSGGFNSLIHTDSVERHSDTSVGVGGVAADSGSRFMGHTARLPIRPSPTYSPSTDCTACKATAISRSNTAGGLGPVVRGSRNLASAASRTGADLWRRAAVAFA